LGENERNPEKARAYSVIIAKKSHTSSERWWSISVVAILEIRGTSDLTGLSLLRHSRHLSQMGTTNVAHVHSAISL
jgi:hypothetical protein